MSGKVWLALGLAVVGAGLIVVGVVVGSPGVGIAATYVTPGYGVGGTGYVSLIKRPPLLDPRDGNLWLGAGIAVCVVAAGTLAVVLARAASRRREGDQGEARAELPA